VVEAEPVPVPVVLLGFIMSMVMAADGWKS